MRVCLTYEVTNNRHRQSQHAYQTYKNVKSKFLKLRFKREIEKERERQRETKRERERQTERDKERERERICLRILIFTIKTIK